MSSHLKALAVLLVLAVVVLVLARPLATEHAIRPEDYKRRAILWIAVTLAAFLSRNYWLYAAISGALILITARKDSHRFALFFFILFVIPPFPVSVPGFGIFGATLVQIDHVFWLAILLLLPLWWKVRREAGVAPMGSHAVDKFVLAFTALQLILQFMETSFTNVLRLASYTIAGAVLPYYVASRLRNLAEYRDVLMSFVVAACILAPIAFFEMVRHWLLYSTVPQMLAQPYWGLTNNLARGGELLRAVGTAGQPIVLGYVMAVAICLLPFLRRATTKTAWLVLGFLCLLAGLIGPLSRGPWVGAAAGLALLLVTGPNVGSKLGKAMLIGVLSLPFLAMTPQAAKLIDYLPFVGTVDAGTVDFRSRLLDVSLGVIGHYPWFGSLGLHADMEQMRGSDGIIDVVNTYIFVALRSGLVGLTLFLMPFVIVILGMLRSLFVLDNHSELHLLGRALLAAMVSILVTIGTVSSIVFIPILYWSVLGMCVGYLRLVAQQEATLPGRTRVAGHSQPAEHSMGKRDARAAR
jgi:hypothetical protein